MRTSPSTRPIIMSLSVDDLRAELARLTKNLGHLECELKAMYKLLRGDEMQVMAGMIAKCLGRIAETQAKITAINGQLSAALLI